MRHPAGGGACKARLSKQLAVIAPGHRYKTDRGADSGKAFLPPQHIGKEIRVVFHPRFS